MHRIEAYIRLALIFIIVIGILYMPILFILKKKGKSVIRQLGYIGIFSSIFLIIFATILFVPINFHPDKYVLNLNPFDWMGNKNSIWQFIVEKVPNVILFMPFGFFLPIVFKTKRKFLKTVIISFGITFFVEFIQYFIGRSSDIVDILTNLFGAIIGYSLFYISNNILYKKKWWNILLGNEQ